MKLYKDYIHSSVNMSKDEFFRKSLKEVFQKNEINKVVESGTFEGTGSTRLLAEAIVESGSSIQEFLTIEVDKNLYTRAKKNLKEFDFITCIWGLSVSKDNAMKFVREDEAIANHKNYPEVFIDDIENPVAFYSDEIEGQLSKYHVLKKESVKEKVFNFFVQQAQPTFEEDVLNNRLNKDVDELPLILLDSAGGIGYLEFKTVLKIMENKELYLVLDDIHHLKHFRSFENVKTNNRFEVLAESLENGWVIAKYS